MHCQEKHRLQRKLFVQGWHKKVVSSKKIAGLIPICVSGCVSITL